MMKTKQGLWRITKFKCFRCNKDMLHNGSYVPFRCCIKCYGEFTVDAEGAAARLGLCSDCHYYQLCKMSDCIE
jgi:hypothetical protein